MAKPMKGVHAKHGVYWYTRTNGKEQWIFPIKVDTVKSKLLIL